MGDVKKMSTPKVRQVCSYCGLSPQFFSVTLVLTKTFVHNVYQHLLKTKICSVIAAFHLEYSSPKVQIYIFSPMKIERPLLEQTGIELHCTFAWLYV